MPSPSTAIAGQVTGIKSLFAKFEQINDPLISSFAGSVPETFPEIVEHISSRNVLVTDFILQNRTKLRSLVQKFHTQAGTSTPGVENSIALLSDPTTQILVSTHQPNLFPYGGILKKIVLLEALKESIGRLNGGKKIVNLFIVVDHDFVDETWIRQAQLPSIKHSSGIMEIRLPVKDSKRWQMVCNVALPSRYLLNHWKLQVKSWIRLHTGRGINCDKRTLMANLEDFWQRVMVASYSRASSYADLNSFALSKLANEVWNYSTIFVRLSEMSSVFENGFAFLIANHAAYSDALKRAEGILMSRGIDTGVSPSSYLNAPLWLHCPCGSKASARISNNNDDLLLAGSCMSCEKELQLNLGDQDDFDISRFIRDLSPRAIPIPLLLTRDLGVSCYASGTGGLGYLIDGNVICKNLSLNLPLVVLWPSRDICNGIAQTGAAALLKAAGVENTEHNLTLLRTLHAEYQGKLKPLLTERAEKVEAGEPITDLLERLLALKVEQRKIRLQINTAERARSVIGLAPCCIDYVVNYGMEATEETWKNHLLKDGRLASPVIFS